MDRHNPHKWVNFRSAPTILRSPRSPQRIPCRWAVRTVSWHTMDERMLAMREMHEKMKRARTPEEKSALMAEHMELAVRALHKAFDLEQAAI